MALVLGGAISDRVTTGPDASVDNLSAFSLLFWVYPTTITHFRRLWCKNAGNKSLEIRNNSGQQAIRAEIIRATTIATLDTASNVITTNSWQCFCLTYDGTDGPRLFKGTLTTAMAEVSYGSRSAGSGAETDDSGAAIVLGNRETFGLAFQGQMAVYKHFNTRMTVGEIQRHQFHDIPASNCVVHWRLGYSGTTTQVDWSGTGNAGTITGATIGAGLPIPYRRHGQLYVPYAVAAAASTVKSLAATGVG